MYLSEIIYSSRKYAIIFGADIENDVVGKFFISCRNRQSSINVLCYGADYDCCLVDITEKTRKENGSIVRWRRIHKAMYCVGFDAGDIMPFHDCVPMCFKKNTIDSVMTYFVSIVRAFNLFKGDNEMAMLANMYPQSASFLPLIVDAKVHIPWHVRRFIWYPVLVSHSLRQTFVLEYAPRLRSNFIISPGENNFFVMSRLFDTVPNDLVEAAELVRKVWTEPLIITSPCKIVRLLADRPQFYCPVNQINYSARTIGNSVHYSVDVMNADAVLPALSWQFKQVNRKAAINRCWLMPYQATKICIYLSERVVSVRPRIGPKLIYKRHGPNKFASKAQFVFNVVSRGGFGRRTIERSASRAALVLMGARSAAKKEMDSSIDEIDEIFDTLSL